MKKLLAFVFVLFSLSLSAQTPTHNCGTTVRHMGNIDHCERVLQDHISSRNRALNDVYVIPTVFHVIHLGEPVGSGTNISDEQLYSAVVALNEDFRKIPGTNGDGIGVDTNIEFCLAVRDPDGNPHSGINRVDGRVVTNYEELGIETVSDLGASEEDIKNLSKWDQEQYMNVWIVSEIGGNNAMGGVQGYAYLPQPDLHQNDGIVILHNAIGTVGNLKPNTQLNRVLTHEAGHYLDLYHTFHNSSDCIESNCETNGDRVCDTPVTTLNTTCSSPACDGTQQVENYMDYTSGTCKNAYTAGQTDRMRAAVEVFRPEILLSLGCQPSSTVDAGINDVLIPTMTACAEDIIPVVRLINYGADDLTSVVIKYQFSTSDVFEYTWSGLLTTGQIEDVELPTYTLTTSDTQLIAYTELPGDEIPENDAWLEDFTTIQSNGLQLDLVLDFFGSETTWEIRDTTNTLLLSGGPYQNNMPGLLTEDICLASGCYEFTIFDDFGDGMSFIDGSYILYDDETTYAEGGGDFGDFETTAFCIEEPCFGDINGDGERDVADLLFITGSYGSSGENIPGDINGDGAVNASDILDFIGVYGTSCP